MSRNQDVAKKLAMRIVVQVRKSAGRGVQAASRFLAARIKETLSEPAPRRPVRDSATGGILYYRAKTVATPGAPPRKLSGRLRTSVTASAVNLTTAVVGASARGMPSSKHPRGFNYPRYLETGRLSGGKLGAGAHPYVQPTIQKYRREMSAVVGKPVAFALKGR